MKNKIVVSDTNIFLDLISIDLLDRFFELPFKVYTTDFIINEITIPEQKEKIDFHTDCKDIEVVSFNPNDTPVQLTRQIVKKPQFVFVWQSFWRGFFVNP